MEPDCEKPIEPEADKAIHPGAFADKARRVWRNRNARCVAYAAILTLALFAITRFVPDMPPIMIAVLWAGAAAFSATGAAYHGTMKRISMMHRYQQGGIGVRMRRGRIVTLLGAFIVAFVFVGSMFFSMAKWSAVEWLIIACGPILLLPAMLISDRIVQREFNPAYRTDGSVPITTIVLGLMLTTLYIPALIIAGGLGAPESAAKAVADAAAVFADSPSALLCVAGKLNALADGMTAYMLGQTAEGSAWLYVALKVALAAMAFFGYAGLIAALTIDKDEFLRIFARVGEDAERAAAPKVVWGWAALAAALPLALVAIFPFIDGTVGEIAKSEPYTKAEAFVRDQVSCFVIVIDGKFYDPAAVRELADEATARYEALSAETRGRLTEAINTICDRQIANVDGYLDWYYSLPADYARLAQVITGTIEESMQEQLTQRLNEGIDTSQLTELMDGFAAQTDAIRQEFEIGLTQCEVTGIPEWLLTPTEQLSSATRLAPPEPAQQLLEFRERTVVSAGAGVAGGILVKKAVEKIVASESFQQLTEQLMKAIGRSSTVKLITTAAGTAIAPVAGTAAGIGISIAVDYLFLKADEALNRDAYREDIVASIEEGRTELLGLVAG